MLTFGSLKSGSRSGANQGSLSLSEGQLQAHSVEKHQNLETAFSGKKAWFVKVR